MLGNDIFIVITSVLKDSRKRVGVAGRHDVSKASF